ncbi:VOC family protein [Cellulomonas sp. KRMCY2]|uniref:VOC family protein n=1 Tax=Cellulomonas sp. KRMCY2 TaxID=1304865 RepID=UPI00045EA116|nr:VOC family protein [Cellulomonas sp. KRMCY2]
MGTIVHVEITAEDPAASARFYAHAFGWATVESPFAPGYHLAKTGPGQGIDAALMSRSWQAQPAIAWIQVDDLDAARSRVVAAGGGLAGDVDEIPGQGRVCYVTDPEGTVLGIKEVARS